MQRRRLATAIVAMAAAAGLGAPATAEGPARLDVGVGRRTCRTRIAWCRTSRTTPRNNRDNKVDLYLPRGADGPTPVLMYIHGGGWRAGLEGGQRPAPAAVAGEGLGGRQRAKYRLAQVSLAPAAVEDCLCALRWVIRNAEQYNIDASRVVVTGNSAGGHLALTTGMAPASAGLDRECPGAGGPVGGRGHQLVRHHRRRGSARRPNMKLYAVTWLGSLPDRFEVAERVSPLTYVRSGLPPVLTIHGDADGVVPYQHATELHAKLEAAGVASELHTVPGGGHGGFNREETVAIFETIQRFLATHGLTAAGAGSTTGGQ